MFCKSLIIKALQKLYKKFASLHVLNGTCEFF